MKYKITIDTENNGEVSVYIERAEKGISIDDCAALVCKLGMELTYGHRQDLEKDGNTTVFVYI